MEVEKVKVLVLGPSQSGKTVITNWLTGHQDPPTDSESYKETVACRVLEYTESGLNFHREAKEKTIYGGNESAAVEIWDVSGNMHRYQACWPAIQKDVAGLIFVMNPEFKNQDKEVEHWYKTFTTACDLPDASTLIISHRKDPTAPHPGRPRLTRALAKLPLTENAIEPNSEGCRPDITRFIENCVIARRDSERQKVLDEADATGRGVGGKTTINMNMNTELR